MSSRKTGSSRGDVRRWCLWICAVLLLTLITLPIAQVTWVRFHDPSVTPLMVLRGWEDRPAGKPDPARQYQWRPWARIPREFLKAVLTAEDQRFFQHDGIDWKEIELARKKAERTGQPVRGASTITMQCARSLFLWQGRSWIRKGLEAYYTFWMEKLLSKHRILELYANVIEMGDEVYGIEAAALTHFGVHAQALNREQCVALAAILPNPRGWDPKQPSPRVMARITKIQQQARQVQFPKLESDR